MRLLSVGLTSLLMVAAWAQSPETGADSASQAAADYLKEFAGTDGAFIAAGLVKSNYQRDNLATLMEYPTDEIVVVNLTGAQIRQAFERSLSFFPQPNSGFLQISGFEVTFNRSGGPNSRVVSVTAGGSALENGKTYSIAMPANLGRGGLGYFKIWDKSKIAKTIEGATVESVLKGKRFVESSPRWSPQG